LILTDCAEPKNALFATGSDRGGEHWAVITSLIETCKLCSVESHTYLADVIITVVNGHLNTRIDDLLPRAYHRHPGTQERGLKNRLRFLVRTSEPEGPSVENCALEVQVSTGPPIGDREESADAETS
jgi:IS66 C-terminal element